MADQRQEIAINEAWTSLVNGIGVSSDDEKFVKEIIKDAYQAGCDRATDDAEDAAEDAEFIATRKEKWKKQR